MSSYGKTEFKVFIKASPASEMTNTKTFDIAWDFQAIEEPPVATYQATTQYCQGMNCLAPLALHSALNTVQKSGFGQSSFDTAMAQYMHLMSDFSLSAGDDQFCYINLQIQDEAGFNEALRRGAQRWIPPSAEDIATARDLLSQLGIPSKLLDQVTSS